MAYSSSTNPFFMVNKHKRSFGDAGNRTQVAFRHPCATNFMLCSSFLSVYSKYDMPEKKLISNSPSHGHH
jgi:hypothetical protein